LRLFINLCNSKLEIHSALQDFEIEIYPIKCADVLAKLGVSSNSPMVVLETPPPQLSNSLGVDA
jgi:hypothetical protein